MPYALLRPAANVAVIVALAMAVAGCNTLTRLWEVGSEPNLGTVSNPKDDPAYASASLPMPQPTLLEGNSSSLWRTGAKAFFKDIRAKEVGDILTVKLRLDDSAKLENKTTRKRDDSEDMQINTILGYEASLNDIFPEAVNLGGTMLDFETDHQTLGNGDIDRSEEIELEVAAVVAQVLPNGSLAILGRQELRVNFELRELLVAGIVRPQDIEADNTIPHERIAEMRLAYGGRGTLSDLQQPRWGTQVWDILWPF